MPFKWFPVANVMVRFVSDLLVIKSTFFSLYWRNAVTCAKSVLRAIIPHMP